MSVDVSMSTTTNSLSPDLSDEQNPKDGQGRLGESCRTRVGQTTSRRSAAFAVVIGRR